MLFSHMCDMRVPLTNFYRGKFFVDPIGGISLEYYLILRRNTYYPIYSLISRSFFYLEYGLYFVCGLYAQHTQRDKVFT